MIREDIIRMAQEAGFGNYAYEARTMFERFFHMAQAAERSNWPAEMEAMERQVNILTDELAKAVAAEREACAKVCEERTDPFGYANLTAEACAAAIRARGQA